MTTNWLTVFSFTLPHEAHLAKTKLESEGFDVMIKDELTVQADNFISNAIGGVKLQVQEADYERALQVLKDSGYIIEPPPKQSTFWVKFDKTTSGFPFIGKSIPELRLLILVAIALVLIVVPIVLLSLPSVNEQLTKQRWCVERFMFQGKEYQPSSGGIKITFNNDCSETLLFSKDGSAYLPGFNSYPVNARWKMEDDQLVIYKADTFQHVYNGKYAVEIKENSIFLTSEHTRILGYHEF